MPDSHTQRIAAVREAVQNAQDRLVGFTDTAPNVRYIRALQARLAADLEHLAEHEAAEAANCAPCEVTAWHDCPQCMELRLLRRHTERIARLLRLAQGGENAPIR